MKNIIDYKKVRVMANLMKFIIGGVLGFMFGGGLEFEYARGFRDTQAAMMSIQLGGAYGCGELAGKASALRIFKPDANQLPELPMCADFRDMWERSP